MCGKASDLWEHSVSSFHEDVDNISNLGSVHLLELNHGNRCEQHVLYIAVIERFHLSAAPFSFSESFLFLN